MEKTDRGAAAKKIALPLAQTVFLPKTAMGVRYIENIRTTVYAEKVTQQQARCLRGFYELDLEYHGLEGMRLYKHRVMLPLCAELPAGWLPGQHCDVSDMHIVIGTPQIQILSPYVLEFSARLWIECIDSSMEEDAKSPALKHGIRHWSSDIPPVLQDEAAKRLESKIDRMFFREMADDGEMDDMPRNIAGSMIAGNMETKWEAKREEKHAADEHDTADGQGFRLPVWRRGARLPQHKQVRMTSREVLGRDMHRQDMNRNSMNRNDMNRTDMNEDTVLGMTGAEGSCDSTRMPIEHRIRRIFSHRGMDERDICYQEVDMMAETQMPMGNISAESDGDVADDIAGGFGLPVWQRRGDARQMKPARKMASPYGVAALRDKILGRLEQDNEYASPGVFKTGQAAEGPKADENLPPQQPNRGKLRSMLAAAAIARLQAHGEKVRMIEAAQTVAENRDKAADAAPMAEPVEEGAAQELIKERAERVEKHPVEKVGMMNDDAAVVAYNAGETVRQMPRDSVREDAREDCRSTLERVAMMNDGAVVVTENAGENAGQMPGDSVREDVRENGRSAEERVAMVNDGAEIMAENVGESAVAENVMEVVGGDVIEDMSEGAKGVVTEVVTEVVMEAMAGGLAESVDVEMPQVEMREVEMKETGTKEVDMKEVETREEAKEVVMKEVEIREAEMKEMENDGVREAAAEIAVEISGESSGQDVAAEVTEAVEVTDAAADAAAAEVVQDAEVGQKAADGGQVRLINTNGVRLRMNNGTRQSMALPSVGGKTGGCALKYYVVKPGDDPMGIALKHNVSLESLRAGNKLPEGELTAGMVLRIPC